jgi:hypothetical protein
MSVVPLSGLLGLAPGEHEGASDSTWQNTPSGDAENAARSIAEELPPLPSASIVLLTSGEELRQRSRAAEQRGLMSVSIPAPRAADRGKLALVVEEAIESALERRGACPPGIGAASDLDASLGDQLYRARLVELRGLFLALGPLEGIAGLSGTLDAEDSAVLRFWLEAPRTRPVEVALDERNRSLAVYGPPVVLESLLAGEQRPIAETVPDVSPAIAASARAMELSETPPPVGEPEAPPAAEVTQGNPALAGDVAQVLLDELARAEFVGLDTPAAPPVLDTLEATAPAAALQEPEQAESMPDAPNEVVSAETPSEPRAPVEAPATEVASVGAPACEVESDAAPALDPSAGEAWPGWLEELEKARGPKPLAAVERMFVQSYVPLRDAYLRGIAPAEVGSALEGWAASFAKSYADAFEALCVRGKRPSMVLDVPDAALRIGRLHGARSVQLLLVDGMRFDLGLRAERLVRERLGGEVALTERLLLWSALPADTNTQLALLGRGPEALRELRRGIEGDIPVARGRMAKTPRRIKTGHRELLKLDLVEARLSEAGPPEAERLDALSIELAESIAELCEKLPTRTLLVAFGDHGFLLDPQGSGTGAARQGGARPEEVLVPAFAWLVGGVQ